tara:strand:- start:130 stop:333 length:204 start_codon:yes stop_codon:yes gene_type:complete
MYLSDTNAYQSNTNAYQSTKKRMVKMTYKMETYYWDGVSVCGICTPQMIWWASGYICEQVEICANEK